jgi:anti-sigma B factor antagonist
MGKLGMVPWRAGDRDEERRMSRAQNRLEPESLRIEATHAAGTVTFRVAGELDTTTRDHLQARIEDAIAGRPESITVDASELVFLDSSGFAALLRAKARAKEASVPFRIVDPSPALRRVADVGGVGDAFLSDW